MFDVIKYGPLAPVDPLRGFSISRIKGKFVAKSDHYQIEAKTMDGLHKEASILWRQIASLHESLGITDCGPSVREARMMYPVR